jgi:hypothetical protein
MDINYILYIITFLAIFVYLLKINRLLYYYIFTCLILVGIIVSKDFTLSIVSAGITTALIYVFLDKQIPLRFKKSTIRAIKNAEHYENLSKKKSKKETLETDNNDSDKDDLDKVELDKDDYDKDDSDKDEIETRKKSNKKTSKKVKQKKRVVKTEDSESEQEDFEPLDNKLNSKESFKTLINSLKSSEISSLNNDTKALIDTQKQLMETLQSMGPALKEGKSILDTFKNYFNDANLDKLSI